MATTTPGSTIPRPGMRLDWLRLRSVLMALLVTALACAGGWFLIASGWWHVLIDVPGDPELPIVLSPGSDGTIHPTMPFSIVARSNRWFEYPSAVVTAPTVTVSGRTPTPSHVEL